MADIIRGGSEISIMHCIQLHRSFAQTFTINKQKQNKTKKPYLHIYTQIISNQKYCKQSLSYQRLLYTAETSPGTILNCSRSIKLTVVMKVHVFTLCLISHMNASHFGKRFLFWAFCSLVWGWRVNLVVLKGR